MGMRREVTYRRINIDTAGDGANGIIEIDDNGRGGHEVGVPIALSITSLPEGEYEETVYLSLSVGKAKRIVQALSQAIEEVG